MEGDFGGTVKAEGYADGAQAAVDVELHAAEAVGALGVESSALGKNDGADERAADLAAVGVAAEHEADGLAGGHEAERAGEIGCVAKQDYGLARLIAYGSGNSKVRDRVA